MDSGSAKETLRAFRRRNPCVLRPEQSLELILVFESLLLLAERGKDPVEVETEKLVLPDVGGALLPRLELGNQPVLRTPAAVLDKSICQIGERRRRRILFCALLRKGERILLFPDLVPCVSGISDNVRGVILACPVHRNLPPLRDGGKALPVPVKGEQLP